MKRTALLIVALGIAWSGIASAATEELMYYAGGQYEFVNLDARRAGEQGQGGRLFFGVPLVDYASLELSARYTFSELKFNNPSCSGPCNDHMLAFGTDLAVSPWRGPVAPFMILGVGVVRDAIGGGSENSFFANAGAGFWVRIWNGLFFRAEARRVGVFGGGPVSGATTLNDTHIGAGLQYMWFKQVAQAKPRPLPAAPPPPDPCKLDSDHDGVPDCRDKCPETPPGFKVDEEGCIIEKQTVVLLNRVLFTLNSSDLKPEAAEQLDQIVAGLKAQPTVTVEVGGHTCNIGTESYNLALSHRRAEAVRTYLTNHGIEASRLTSEGYGEFSPIANNETEEGRQQNRRVEFRILTK
jgi:OmpA-OmpF porin, OOP family